ncbi:MAG: hypothetical protein H6Q05_3566 [Acidobacteria bacterium]|nr:hypothetical protein [Acidobacteriota bacterium]
MNTNIGKLMRFALLLLALALGTLLCSSAWTAADGPVAKFPGFTPFAVSAEGVAVDKIGNVYVSIRDGVRGKILKFTPTGVQSLFADIGEAEADGLAVDAAGDVYIAMALGIDRGVYRVSREGESIILPGSEQILYPDALAFDNRGNLYVTELFSMDSPPAFGPGGIWRIPPKGAAELWLRDDLLTGTGATGLGSPAGANGIAYFHGDLYVINSDKALVVRIPVRPDGSPGQPDVWATLQDAPESPFPQYGFPPFGDGLALDVHGNVYVALAAQCAIVRINAHDRSQETIAALLFDPQDPLFAPFDFPTSLAFGTGKGGRESLFVAGLGWLGSFGFPGPGPGLVKIEIWVPGLPLN